MFSFRNGMETLVHALAVRLENHVKLDCGVKSLHYNKEGITLHTDEGAFLEADKVFLAVPQDVLATILQGIGVSTRETPTSSVAAVNMGWKQSVLPYQGFGHLIASREKEDVLGVVWDSSAFPEQNCSPDETRLTVMLGGIHRPDLLTLSEPEITSVALKAVAKQLGINKAPDVLHVSVARNAIPQYVVGHEERVKKLEADLEKAASGRIVLVGSAWHGVAVNDCIANAFAYA
jgi:oxygen-dependent protoporphyrinogen oxidase